MSSNVERNAEIDARHAKEPETEFSFTVDWEETIQLREFLGETPAINLLDNLYGEVTEWLERNGYI